MTRQSAKAPKTLIDKRANSGESSEHMSNTKSQDSKDNPSITKNVPFKNVESPVTGQESALRELEEES